MLTADSLPPSAFRLLRTLSGVLRAAFWLTALLFIPLGLLIYFLPPALASAVGVSPLWLARVAGGLMLAWGAFQLAASATPDGVKVGGLVGGNLLTVAALVPAVLRGGDLLAPGLRNVLLLLAGFLLMVSVLAMLSYPPRRTNL